MDDRPRRPSCKLRRSPSEQRWGKSQLAVTSDLQAFGLIVTAEPYFAVTQPSDVVVMENQVRSDTAGTIEQVDAKFELPETWPVRTQRQCDGASAHNSRSED